MLCRTMLVALAALTGCGRPPSVKPSPDGPAPVHPTTIAGRPDTAALARDIPHLLQVSGIPGLSLAVIQSGGVIWTRGFGTANDSSRTPVDTNTIFEAASLSKPVFAYLILRLADRGEFDLDRPLFELLEYSRLAYDERSKRITGRMVLTHGTGLPNWGGERLTLRFTPGAAYGYSGEGFVFLQKVLEHITGRPLEELARREVFQPLGMRRSSFVWEERFADHAASAQNWLWNVGPIDRFTEANAAYTLLTTATDYGQFVAAVLTGRGLSPELWKEFLTPARESSAGLGVGLGIRVEAGPAGRTFYHSGNNGRRFTCYMVGDIATGTGLVYFTGSYNGTSLVEALAAPVLGQEHPPRHWAEYDRYDDPQLLAMQSVQRAAVENGADAARERFRAIQSSPHMLSFERILELGAFLTGRGLAPFSIEVLERAVTDFPDSASAHVALGRAQESAGDLDSAMRSYRHAQALEGDSGDAQRQIRWAQDRLAARARGVAVPRRTLVRYTGLYQQRAVTLREGRLYYKEVANPASALTPIAQDLFELEADPMVRIRFVGDGAGPAAKLIAIYDDGSTDEWARSP